MRIKSVTFLCRISLLLMIPLVAFAQTHSTGAIGGRVINSLNGSSITSARVVVSGTNLETLTNNKGEYYIANVPAGAAKVTVIYTGFRRQTIEVNVAAGNVVQQPFELSLSDLSESSTNEGVYKLDAFKVYGREMSAQAAALNAQKNAGNIKNVVTFDQFSDMGESNPAEFLKYVPGITIGFDPAGASSVVVRGMPSNGTVVLIDGAPAISASGDRSFNFQRTPSANVERIEVNKSPTPDIPANSIGGSINVVKKTGFSRTKPLATVNTFVLFNEGVKNGNVGSLFKDRVGSRFTARPVQPGADVSLLMPLNKSLAFTFNAGANRRYYDIDTIQSFWNHVTMVNERLAKTDVINIFDRKYASAVVDWKIAKYDTITASAQYSILKLQQSTAGVDIRYGTGAVGGEDFTRSSPGAGVVAQLYNGNDAWLPSHNLALRYLHDGPVWQVAVDLAYSHVKADSGDTRSGFFRTLTPTLSGLTLSGTGMSQVNDGLLPTLVATNSLGQTVNPYDGRLTSISAVDSAPQKYTDESKNINAYVQRDLPTAFPLKVKLGVSVNDRVIDRTLDLTTWAFSPPGGVPARLASNYDLFDEKYTNGLTWKDTSGQSVDWKFPSVAKMYSLFEAHPEYFVKSDAANYVNHVNNSKQINERISAAYLRIDAKFLNNRLKVVTGVRFEKTADRGLGPLNNVGAIYQRDAAGNILRDGAGTALLISTDAFVRNKAQYTERGAKTDKDYSGYYPSLNTSYAITEDIIVRASYAKTIGRPSMNEIIPGVTLPNPTTVVVGTPSVSLINTGLKPWSADNYDFSLESYNFKGAVISIGLFQKNIKDFFATVTTPATPELLALYGLSDEYLTYNIVTKQNAGDAQINGFEWSWSQKLHFLPNWAKGFNVFANATYLRVTGLRVANFTGYRSRSVNLGLGYTRSRLAFKINATLGTKIPQGSVAQSATIPADTVTYTAPSTVVDLSIDYKITKKLAFYGTARNASFSDIQTHIAAPLTPDYAKVRTAQRFGSLMTLGLKYQF